MSWDFDKWRQQTAAIEREKARALNEIVVVDTAFQNDLCRQGGTVTSTLTEDAEAAAAAITTRFNTKLEALHSSQRPAMAQAHRALVASVLEAGQLLSEKLHALTAFELQAEAFGPARLRRRVSDPTTPDHLRGLVSRAQQFVEPVPVRPVAVRPTMVRPDFQRILAKIFG
jgi:hypothetical protein